MSQFELLWSRSNVEVRLCTLLYIAIVFTLNAFCLLEKSNWQRKGFCDFDQKCLINFLQLLSRFGGRLRWYSQTALWDQPRVAILVVPFSDISSLSLVCKRSKWDRINWCATGLQKLLFANTIRCHHWAFSLLSGRYLEPSAGVGKCLKALTRQPESVTNLDQIPVH